MEEVICPLVPALALTAKARDETGTLEVLEHDGDDGDDQEDPNDRQALDEGIDRFGLCVVELARFINRGRSDHRIANEYADLRQDQESDKYADDCGSLLQLNLTSHTRRG
jgi:hypothetical protein